MSERMYPYKERNAPSKGHRIGCFDAKAVLTGVKKRKIGWKERLCAMHPIVVSRFVKGVNKLEVKLEDVITAIHMLVDKAKKQGISAVELNDYYWSVAAEERENVTVPDEPSLVVGSLVDDWESILKMINGQNPPSIVDFERLGNVLISIGEAIHHSHKPY